MTPRELETLVHRHLDGLATAEELAALSGELERDEGSRVLYLQLAELHAALAVRDDLAGDSVRPCVDSSEVACSQENCLRLAFGPCQPLAVVERSGGGDRDRGVAGLVGTAARLAVGPACRRGTRDTDRNPRAATCHAGGGDVAAWKEADGGPVVSSAPAWRRSRCGTACRFCSKDPGNSNCSRRCGPCWTAGRPWCGCPRRREAFSWIPPAPRSWTSARSSA